MLKRFNRLLALAAALVAGVGINASQPVTQEPMQRTAAPTVGGDQNVIVERAIRRRQLADARKAAAERAKPAREAAKAALAAKKAGKNASIVSGTKLPFVHGVTSAPYGTMDPLGVPDYMGGVISNYANSPLPNLVQDVNGVYSLAPGNTAGIHKFVDSLPGLGYGNRNNLNNYIPLAVKDTTTFPGSDFYDISIVDYTQKLHTDLGATHLRGYKDNLASGTDAQPHYLGPVIIAQKDRPVRVKFTNALTDHLRLPVDTTLMGAGTGPGGTFSKDRAELHLHGGKSPWISDGTPHQWFTPAADASTAAHKGVSFRNVPDMIGKAGITNGASDGIGSYFWTNQQSGRFMFYHDHSFGLTRLNVYYGEAAGYLIVDPTEENLITTGVFPNQGGIPEYKYGIPLIFQDKTFVPNATQLATTDPTWDPANWGATAADGALASGDLWYPHVYMTNQNPGDLSGANAMGRWDYGPWFWPPVPVADAPNSIPTAHGPVPQVVNGVTIDTPGTPNPSLTPESFMDTAVVNGTPYPYLTIEPKAYRFRLLNAANDRMFAYSFYTADPANPTEVKMIEANPTNAAAATAYFTARYPGDPNLPVWPKDGRDGGVVDFATAGPEILQIGNEAGLLPNPVLWKAQATNYNYNRRDIVVLDVAEHGLFLGPAERADIIVDFSNYAGQTLILYNDMLAPVPAFDVRYDYFTGAPDQGFQGGAPPSMPGYGPNTRTLMQFRVAASATTPATTAGAFDPAKVTTAFTGTATTLSAFADSQHPPIVPQVAYNAAMNTTYVDKWSTIQAYELTYNRTENGDLVTVPFQPKAIQELFELDYGRMNATLGIELPFTNFNNQTTIPLGYSEPATEVLTDGTTQFWKITHNGVDTHPVHFHLFDVQLVNRVGWDGAVRFPEDNEIGWKETVKMKPLEDVVVAFRPLSPRLPFVLGNSIRVIDPTKASNAQISVTDLGTPVNQGNLGNQILVDNGNGGLGYDYGWEYVWHCHILGHEENDFMRPVVLNVATTVPTAPSTLTATLGTPTRADLTWADNATNEVGYFVQRRTGAAAFATIAELVPDVRTYSDLTVTANQQYDYQVIAFNQAGNSAPSNLAGVNGPTQVQVAGTITTVVGAAPLAGVTVTFSNGGGTTTTNASGAYTATLPYGWTGTVTPTLAGYLFTPAVRSYTNVIVNAFAQNFTAAVAVSISGQIYVNNSNPVVNIPGVTVTFSNGGYTAVSGANGIYTALVPSGYTGVATPTLANYTFAPATRTYTNVTATQTGGNYRGSKFAVVSGTVTVNGNPLSGVTITFSNGGGTATTAANGTYTRTLAAGWSGTITPSRTGYVFSPTNATVANIQANQTNDFTVSAVAISGLVYFNSVPVSPRAGVTVTLSGVGSTTTNAQGNYTINVPVGYTGTLTYSGLGYVYTPATRTFTNVTTPQVNMNSRTNL